MCRIQLLFTLVTFSCGVFYSNASDRKSALFYSDVVESNLDSDCAVQCTAKGDACLGFSVPCQLYTVPQTWGKNVNVFLKKEQASSHTVYVYTTPPVKSSVVQIKG